MIDKKTVFVLGAGASCPYGFPSGAQLRRQICLEKRKYLHYLQTVEPNPTTRKDKWKVYNYFADTFFKSSTESIDLFMARNPKLAETGKYIIAYQILTAESTSHFREEAIEEQDWYFHLYKRLVKRRIQGDTLPDLTDRGISFITFNYDRSLEHFLFDSLKHTFTEIPPYKVAAALKGLRIIHVYGRVAPLEWEDREKGIAYRPQINDRLLIRTANNIRTIYEEKENPELQQAQGLLRRAEQIFFLGFGYAPENMEVLGLPEIIPPGNCRFYGTALGLNETEIKRIKDKIRKGLKPDSVGFTNPERVEGIEPVDCLDLLRNHL